MTDRHNRSHAQRYQKNFTEGPYLKGTSSGRMGRFGVGNFRDVAESRLPEMVKYGLEILRLCRLPCGRRVALHPDRGFNKRARQPRPRRALMVGAVLLTDLAEILAHVGRVIGRQGPQSHRCPEALFDNLDDQSSPCVLKKWERQTSPGKI